MPIVPKPMRETRGPFLPRGRFVDEGVSMPTVVRMEFRQRKGGSRFVCEV